MNNRGVGLVVMTEVPEFGLVAVCRERGNFDPERMAPETRPGGCQVTVHGAVEELELFLEGLFRETGEELGKEFALQLLLQIMAGAARLQELIHVTVPSSSGPKEVVTFAIKVDSSLLKEIRLGPESGAIRLITRAQLQDVVDLNGFDKMGGVSDRRVIAMFPDALQAVTKAFALFSGKS